MKKIIVIVLAVLVLLAVGGFIATGLIERTDVALVDYCVADDGSAVTLSVAVPTSMGYVRGYRNSGGGVRPHYLTFYSTFGGLNSSLGAVNAVELELAPDDTEIYFNRSGGGYELVLVKNADTGEWSRPISKS